jgi:putative membrane protein
VLGKLLLYLIAGAVTLVLLAAVFPNHVSYTNYGAVAAFAIVLTILNASIRPVLRFITAPLTCLTLGLSALVVNGAVFYIGAKLVSGISITFLAALVGAIVAGFINGALSRAFERGKV